MSEDFDFKSEIASGVARGIGQARRNQEVEQSFQNAISAIFESSAAKKQADQYQRALHIIENTALVFPNVQRKISIEAWLNRLVQLPYPSFGKEQKIAEYINDVNRELIKAGLFPEELEGALPGLIKARGRMREIEEFAWEKIALYGRFIKPDFENAVEVAQSLADLGLADLEPDVDDLSDYEQEAVEDGTFFRIFLTQNCSHDDERYIFVSFDIWMEDFPQDYLILDAIENASFSDVKVWVVGNGWQVRVDFTPPECCELDEPRLLGMVSKALVGEVIDLR